MKKLALAIVLMGGGMIVFTNYKKTGNIQLPNKHRSLTSMVSDTKNYFMISRLNLIKANLGQADGEMYLSTNNSNN